MAMVGTARQAARAAALVAVGCGVLAAAACVQKPAPTETPPAARLEAPQEDQRPMAPHPARKPAPPTLAALPAPEAAPEAAPAPPPSAEPPDFDKLQGLDQTQTAAVLGEPAQRAEAPPAVLWRYASRDCALDVYFYLDLQSRVMRVLHYEIRYTDGSERSQQKCYGELVTDRGPEQTGSTDSPR